MELLYAAKGLSLLILVPRSRSLQNLAAFSADVNISDILRRMRTVRMAVILPLYTLRMTLLLPNKLHGVSI